MKKEYVGITPLIFFLIFYLLSSILAGDFARMPIISAFLFASIYAVIITRGYSLPDRVRIYGRGAGTTKVMFMIWIFCIAGAFAQCSASMGCIDDTVNLILSVLPARFIYASIFLAGCAISMATGSGVGSIVAVAPIAVGVAGAIGAPMPLMMAIVVCGAMFGDNLSIISDTTIIATSTQGCRPKDKFTTNLKIVLPAAVLTTLIYIRLGQGVAEVTVSNDYNIWNIIPYAAVLVMAISGVDVLITLVSGVVICGVMGMIMGAFDFFGWMQAITAGIESMGSLIIIVIMAAGLMALIRENGGLDFIVSACTKFVRGRMSAEICICLLSALLTVCTSNNTIAIMSVSSIVRELSEKFGVDPRKAACLMDTSTCVTLELLPYSTHLLTAASFAGLAAITMIPHVYYAFLLGICLILSVIFNFPRFTRPVEKV